MQCGQCGPHHQPVELIRLRGAFKRVFTNPAPTVIAFYCNSSRIVLYKKSVLTVFTSHGVSKWRPVYCRWFWYSKALTPKYTARHVPARSFYGGFVFLEEGASISCEGASIVQNHAGDQGGGIYARDATWVNSSCNLISNEAPQGAAAYLTYVKQPMRFENLLITNNVAFSGGSVFYVAESSVVMTEVIFETSIVIQEDSSNRAVQLDEGSTLFGDGCVFTGWLGDTVVRSSNADKGSLVLNSCDFRGNFASMMVVSPNSDAEIRNALVDEITLANAAVEDGSVELVDRALTCSDAGACDDEGGCEDSVLGVLCVCIDEDTPCLIDGGTLALRVATHPESVTYNPNPVHFELTVFAEEGGKTSAIWALSYEADDLELEVVPESGVLPPGESLIVNVTGTPVGNNIGGNLASNFTLISMGNASLLTGSSEGTVVQTLEVRSTFYLCQAFQYAVPTGGDDSTESVECEQCAAIEGAEGVDCTKPGATRASLPIKKRYWRENDTSLTVLSCLYSDACKGATAVNTSEDYCADGYKGPREYRYRYGQWVAWSELSSNRPSIGTKDVCV